MCYDTINLGLKGLLYFEMKKIQTKRDGFTLIELLIVIAIVAILSVVVILTLNPAELLRQARDSNRISDLNMVKSAISLFLADGQATSTNSIGVPLRCYIDGPATNTCVSWLQTQTSTSTSNNVAVNGGGWIPINFNLVSAGAPIGKLPLDPVNNASLFYSYIATSSPNYAFKLATKMESTRYSASGTSDVVSTDGGIDNTTYETGTNLQL